jgi:hypothetical protein
VAKAVRHHRRRGAGASDRRRLDQSWPRSPQRPLGSMATNNVDILHWGIAIEFSTLYLTSRFTGGPPKEEPLNQPVPLVEFAFDSSRGTKSIAKAALGSSMLSAGIEARPVITKADAVFSPSEVLVYESELTSVEGVKDMRDRKVCVRSSDTSAVDCF